MNLWEKLQILFVVAFFSLVYIPLLISIPVHFLLMDEFIHPCYGTGDCASFENYGSSLLLSFLIEIILISLFFIYFIFFRLKTNNGVANNE
jgi:hypothetical protein